MRVAFIPPVSEPKFAPHVLSHSDQNHPPFFCFDISLASAFSRSICAIELIRDAPVFGGCVVCSVSVEVSRPSANRCFRMTFVCTEPSAFVVRRVVVRVETI